MEAAWGNRSRCQPQDHEASSERRADCATASSVSLRFFASSRSSSRSNRSRRSGGREA